MQRVEKMIEVDAPLARVFDLFSDFESFPRWMKNIREVRRTGRRMTRWAADAPLGTSVEWEAEVTSFEPDRRISWRSVRGDVETEGEVIFEETRRGTTMMRVMLGYDPPAGRLGTLVARLFGVNPAEQLSEDLERFAEVAEGRGRRVRDGRSAPERERMREAGPAPGPAAERREYVRMQLERRRREAYERETGERHRDERGGYDPRFREREARERREREEPRRYREMREARDSRERDDERRSGTPERKYEVEHERRPAPRYAMTPRERERERAQRPRDDDEYSRTAFRRGIDRLLDEPPSRDWHRWKRERKSDE
jgi:uncharacterized protein YndB with AHSA1/START domain